MKFMFLFTLCLLYKFNNFQAKATKQLTLDYRQDEYWNMIGY